MDGKGLRDFYHNRTNPILQQLKRNFWKIARDGPRFGQTEAGFCLRFGLSGNRIFGSETEEEALRRSRAEHRFAASAANFFFRKHITQ
jgi:hypothetical protein